MRTPEARSAPAPARCRTARSRAAHSSTARRASVIDADLADRRPRAPRSARTRGERRRGSAVSRKPKLGKAVSQRSGSTPSGRRQAVELEPRAAPRAIRAAWRAVPHDAGVADVLAGAYAGRPRRAPASSPSCARSRSGASGRGGIEGAAPAEAAPQIDRREQHLPGLASCGSRSGAAPGRRWPPRARLGPSTRVGVPADDRHAEGGARRAQPVEHRARCGRCRETGRPPPPTAVRPWPRCRSR